MDEFTVSRAEHFQGFKRELLFFISDVWDDVIQDIERSDSRMARTADRLGTDDVNLLDPHFQQRGQAHDHRRRRAIGIRDDPTAPVAVPLLGFQ